MYQLIQVWVSLQVIMPTEQDVEAANIDKILEDLAGSGNTELLTTYILASSSVTASVS